MFKGQHTISAAHFLLNQQFFPTSIVVWSSHFEQLLQKRTLYEWKQTVVALLIV